MHKLATTTVLESRAFSYLHMAIFMYTPAYTDFFTSNFVMAASASTELDLKRTAFALSSDQRALGLSLDNDLHPLYRHCNFKASALTRGTTGEEVGEPLLEARAHARMIPALRLASLLLDFSLPFLTKACCANLIFVGEQYAFDPLYECTIVDIERVRGLLVEWADRTRFYTRTPEPPPAPDGSFKEATTEVRTGGRPLPTPARSLISIRTETINFFSQENYDKIDAETKTAQLIT